MWRKLLRFHPRKVSPFFYGPEGKIAGKLLLSTFSCKADGELGFAIPGPGNR